MTPLQDPMIEDRLGHAAYAAVLAEEHVVRRRLVAELAPLLRRMEAAP